MYWAGNTVSDWVCVWGGKVGKAPVEQKHNICGGETKPSLHLCKEEKRVLRKGEPVLRRNTTCVYEKQNLC